MSLGWLRAGTLGATTIGIAFILPSFLMVLALAASAKHSFALELPPGQRSVLYLYSRPAFCQPGCRKPTAVLRKSLRHQVHILLPREIVMKWITRKDIKVDRVACPWLIKRFVDPQAEFLFVEEKDLVEQAKLHDAIPFDAPKIEAIKLNHRGSRCSFEAILEDYAVADSALQNLGLIVRAADVKGQENVAPEGIGLRSIAQGFAALVISDQERLVRQFPIYDALYAYVQGE
jgi:hypothetical protein